MRKEHCYRYCLRSLVLMGFLCISSSAKAAFDVDLLEAARDGSSGTTFSEGAGAMLEAIEFSTRQAPNRAKLPGNMRFFLEGGASAFDIDDKNLALFTDDGFAPDSFETFFLKAGSGLPYGLYADIGVSQVFKFQKLTSLNGNIAFQAMDFANLVYTDMVPSLAVSTGFNYVVSGPSQFSINAQAMLGAYHRLWMAQVSYILSYTWANLTALSPSYSSWFLRHGLSSHWPLFEGIYLSANMFYKPIEAGVTLGYQF